MIEITEPQDGWLRCSKCERDGFRPPWQGYCYDCQRAYHRDRNATKRAAREAFERREAQSDEERELRALAMIEGLDPDS